MNINDFINYLKDLNINPTKDQLDKLDKYYKLLVETNKITNLTRIIEEKEVYLKHFYDSLTITKCIDLKTINTKKSRKVRVLGASTISGLQLLINKIRNKIELTFSEKLIELINEKGKKPAEIYKKADITKEVFSKIIVILTNKKADATI